MADDAQARFDAALKRAGLALDPRDNAAALRVFVSLEAAASLLKAKDADAPR
ncbi:MAG TPA: hypothetical protein PKC09_01490 [Paracoccus sp. (in: a-proteobacteria)]|uniref:hypothetical protein n=1 Tax=uncultured Paracoccus sp. TaxID=189685 RepID=UPI0026330331|nr:hypothetical protein [uncultured Paracoccus sp.]HMQ39921.1 hypothetical protein [Paracoccus sp. (in: a-proteobacteria)]HMR35568.1 hypothetical protein [Paracoccus sp. (in: a-proteobacteria)]